MLILTLQTTKVFFSHYYHHIFIIFYYYYLEYKGWDVADDIDVPGDLDIGIGLPLLLSLL
jgi:hypothetical protein